MSDSPYVNEVLKSGDLSRLQVSLSRLRGKCHRLSTDTLLQLPDQTLTYLIEQSLISADRVSTLRGILLWGSRPLSKDFFRVLIGRQGVILSEMEHLLLHRPHQCHHIDRVIELGVNPTMTLHQLTHPLWYLDWCEQCRERLLPMETCLQSREDFQTAVTILTNDQKSGSHSVSLLQRVLGCQQLLDEETVSSLIRCSVYVPIVLESSLLPKLPYRIYRQQYHPVVDSLFQIELNEIRFSDLCRYLNLITYTDESYWSHEVLSKFLTGDSDKRLDHLTRHLPNLIYHHPTYLWTHRRQPTIRRHNRKLAQTLLLGRHSASCPFSLVGDYVIREIFNLSWRPMTDSGLHCVCGKSAPRKCPYQKCGQCCQCPNHK